MNHKKNCYINEIFIKKNNIQFRGNNSFRLVLGRLFKLFDWFDDCC